MTTDYAITGPPSISLATFAGVLRAAGSPAAPEASGMYDAALRYGVDPAVLLAVFGHESSYGKAGVARSTKSIGNLVYTPASGSLGATQDGRWAAYPSWTVGALDAARLLSSSLYAGSSSYDTVRTFPYRWAPSSDGNAPAQYGASLASAIASWGGGDPVGSSPAPFAATVASKPASSLVPAPSVTAAAVDLTGPAVLVVGGVALLVLVAVLLSRSGTEGP